MTVTHRPCTVCYTAARVVLVGAEERICRACAERIAQALAESEHRESIAAIRDMEAGLLGLAEELSKRPELRPVVAVEKPQAWYVGNTLVRGSSERARTVRELLARTPGEEDDA